MNSKSLIDEFLKNKGNTIKSADQVVKSGFYKNIHKNRWEAWLVTPDGKKLLGFQPYNSQEYFLIEWKARLSTTYPELKNDQSK